jgi:hypothetical protein
MDDPIESLVTAPKWKPNADAEVFSHPERATIPAAEAVVGWNIPGWNLPGTEEKYGPMGLAVHHWHKGIEVVPDSWGALTSGCVYTTWPTDGAGIAFQLLGILVGYPDLDRIQAIREFIKIIEFEEEWYRRDRQMHPWAYPPDPE